MTREDPKNLDPEIEAALHERDGGRCFITGRTAGVQPIYISFLHRFWKTKIYGQGYACILFVG